MMLPPSRPLAFPVPLSATGVPGLIFVGGGFLVVAQEAKGSSCLIFKITDWNF